MIKLSSTLYVLSISNNNIVYSFESHKGKSIQYQDVYICSYILYVFALLLLCISDLLGATNFPSSKSFVCNV